jgi:hypothetical protein
MTIGNENEKMFFIFLDEDQSKENLTKIKNKIPLLKDLKIISKNDKDFNFNKLLNSNDDKEYILDAYTYAEEIENYQKQISTSTNEGIGVLISKLFKTVIIICDEFETPKDIPDIIEVITNLITNDKDKNDLPFVSFTEEKFTSYMYSKDIEGIDIILRKLLSCIKNNLNICPSVFNTLGFTSMSETNKVLNNYLI